MEASSRTRAAGLTRRVAPEPRPASPNPDEAALHVLTGDVSVRLRRVCGHLSDDEFSALVLEIAEVTLRYDEKRYGRRPGRSALARGD